MQEHFDSRIEARYNQNRRREGDQKFLNGQGLFGSLTSTSVTNQFRVFDVLAFHLICSSCIWAESEENSPPCWRVQLVFRGLLGKKERAGF